MILAAGLSLCPTDPIAIRDTILRAIAFPVHWRVTNLFTLSRKRTHTWFPISGAWPRTARGGSLGPVEGERRHREDGEGRLRHLPQGRGPAQHDVRRPQGEGGAALEDASGQRWLNRGEVFCAKVNFQKHWRGSGQSSLESSNNFTSSDSVNWSRGRLRGGTLRLGSFLSDQRPIFALP